MIAFRLLVSVVLAILVVDVLVAVLLAVATAVEYVRERRAARKQEKDKQIKV